MDQKLLAWGLRKPAPLPRLWLFTDERRLPDPRASVANLPRGKAGVVLRHDHDPARKALGRSLHAFAGRGGWSWSLRGIADWQRLCGPAFTCAAGTGPARS